MRYHTLLLGSLTCIGGLQAQSVTEKLQSRAELDSADVANLATFDTLDFNLDLTWAAADTTVVVSDSVLYTILRFGDTVGVNAFFFLMSYNRFIAKPIDVVFLHDSPDIEQSMTEYEWTDHVIWQTGEIGTIEYDCRVSRPGTLHERTSMRATGRRFWRVGPDGRITGGELVKEK